MDDPFDKDGSISETARIVWETDAYIAVSEQAEAGDANAQYQMGQWHHAGGNEAVEKDYAKAAEWFRKAATQGHEKAREQLAKLKQVKNEEYGGKHGQFI